MRVGSCVAIGLSSMVTILAWGLDPAEAMPYPSNPNAGTINIQRVDDTCWWWGTRWQFGWRGYGWYSCWEWPKPAPTAIAPEAVPEEALRAPDDCVQVWRDAAGHRRWRRVC
jgi:hypothetical protein